MKINASTRAKKNNPAAFQSFLRNAAVLSLFATGGSHQVQKAEAAAFTLTGSGYTQNFDSMGTVSGVATLATGWSVYKSATATTLGTATTAAQAAWTTGTGNFVNVAAPDAASGLTGGTSATTAVQNSTLDRALGAQQSGSFDWKNF